MTDEYKTTFQIVQRTREANAILYSYENSVVMTTYDQAIEMLVEFEKDEPSDHNLHWALEVKVQLLTEATYGEGDQ